MSTSGIAGRVELDVGLSVRFAGTAGGIVLRGTVFSRRSSGVWTRLVVRLRVDLAVFHILRSGSVGYGFGVGGVSLRRLGR
jgi:hypothetical protein